MARRKRTPGAGASGRGEQNEDTRHDRPASLEGGELAELCEGGPVLVAVVGLPASGKTTWSERLVQEAPCFVRVNNDELRERHPGVHEAVVRKMRDSLIRKSLAQGKSVVVDNTNLRGLSDLRKLADEHGAEFRVEDLRSVPWQESVRRDDERAARGERATGRSVIIKMAMDAGLFELDSTINKQAVIIDLDGTLSDVSHRIHHLRGGEKPDWRAFFEGIPGDKVNRAVACLYHMAVDSGYTVLFVSGRPEDYRGPSEEWLRDYSFDGYFALFMRPFNNKKPDTEVKAQIYDRYIKPYFDVLFTVDDRDAVVAMWRSKGLVCFQVAAGAY
jgi:predicted kinase